MYTLTIHLVLHQEITGRPPPQNKPLQSHPQASCQNRLTATTRHIACSVTLECYQCQDFSLSIEILTATICSANNSTQSQPHSTYHLHHTRCLYIPTKIRSSTNDNQFQLHSARTSGKCSRTIRAASTKHAPPYNRHQPTEDQ